jgi:hypothetical protein
MKQKPLVMPLWAWGACGVLWLTLENERRLRMIGYRIRSLLV